MTLKAIAAFAALAERLDVLAAERARPWGVGWRAEGGVNILLDTFPKLVLI